MALEFTGSPLADKEAWHLLPTTPAILPASRHLSDKVQKSNAL